MKKPVYLHLLVDLPARTVLAYFRYWPAKRPAHVGPDSPRYLDPGFPGRIDDLHLFENWIDVTDEYDARDLSAINAAIWEVARQPRLPVRVAPVLPAPVSFSHPRENQSMLFDAEQEATL